MNTPTSTAFRRGALLLAVATAACAPTRPAPAPAPAAGDSATAAPASLPPVPLVTGALAPKVVYPPENHLIQARDSTFIFGSTGNGNATLTVNGAPVKVHPNGAWLGWLPVPPREAPRYELVVANGPDTARLTHPVRVLPPPSETPMSAPPRVDSAVTADSASPADSARRAAAAAPEATWVRLGEPLAASDTDRTIVGRPIPAGTYKWFFTPGTAVQLTGRRGAFARVRLDQDLEVWVDSADVKPFGNGAAPAGEGRRTAGNVRVRAATDWSDVVIAISDRAPYLVEETPEGFRLTLYNTVANSDNINYLAVRDPVVQRIDTRQETTDRAVYEIRTVAAPYGYLVFHDGNAMVLRLRRRPQIDRRHPLRGLTIVVDPGHPPGGATGPTGLWEPQAVLAAGQALQRILTERGANVVMTRTSMDAVALVERPVIARRANGHAFVSLHLDAVPDGVNPFLAQGTGTYFYRMHSEPLARAVQANMYRQMGIRDRGVYSANFAVIRNTWMPAVLAEGGFLMIPEQEAAFGNPEFQARYAQGVADGLEEYFRGLAQP